MLTELPPELTADILCRLPVKILLQIRCVSKPWRRFIDSRYFIGTHLNRSIKTRERQFIVSSERSSNVIRTREVPYLQIRLPRWERLQRMRGANVQVWGSCNGLVLVSNLSSTCLCNPSTRKQRILPQLQVCSNIKLLGFGYDSAGDDYRVIKILSRTNRNKHQVWIYSLQSNSWREIGNCFPPNIEFGSQPGVLLHEALHWLVKVKPALDDGVEDFVLAFDLKTEECRMFPQPKKCQNAKSNSMLGACNGLLCLVYSYSPLGLETWVIRDESWTRVTLQKGDVVYYPGGFINSTLRDGKEALLDNFGILFDKNSFKYYSKSDVCMVSLISPDAGTESGQAE